MEILTIILSVCASVISGMALFFFQKHFKRREKMEDEKHSALMRENVLILKSIHAIGKLTESNAIAIRDGKTNGEMHDALDEYNGVEKELFEFLLHQNSRK